MKPPSVETPVSSAILKGTAGLWFVVAYAGQLLFAAYTAIFYGGSTLRGDLDAWNEVLYFGRINGDEIGNAALAAHLFLAFFVTVLGPLQLVPQVRNRLPIFHRWNGRIYLTTGLIAAATGLWLIWSRGALGGVINQLGNTGNAILILLCGIMTIRFALGREFDRHRRWATRFFLVVSAVWFFRVGLMFWIAVNGGPVGIGEKLDGWFAHALSYLEYLVPLGAYELYWRARDHAGAAGRLAMALLLLILTAAMAVGVGVAFVGMWLPRM